MECLNPKCRAALEDRNIVAQGLLFVALSTLDAPDALVRLDPPMEGLICGRCSTMVHQALETTHQQQAQQQQSYEQTRKRLLEGDAFLRAWDAAVAFLQDLVEAIAAEPPHCGKCDGELLPIINDDPTRVVCQTCRRTYRWNKRWESCRCPNCNGDGARDGKACPVCRSGGG